VLLLASCGSDTPPGEDDASTNGGCAECPDSCDTSTGQCADDPDLGDIVEDSIDDTELDEAADEESEPDVADDPVDDERADESQDPEVESDPDVTSDPDVETDPDEGDADAEVVINRDVDPLFDEHTPDVTDTDATDVEDEEIYIPPVVCPFDHLEIDTPNNTFEAASVVTSGPVAGTVGLRASEEREILPCGDLAFRDVNSFNTCLSGGCECETVVDLAVCGISDPDYHTFDVVAGDSVFIRVKFEEPFTVEDVSGALLAPPTGVECEEAETCEDDEGCFAGACRPIIDGDWLDTGGEDQDDTLEFAGLNSLAVDGALANYVLRVNANSEVTYSLLAQVDPLGRACLHDDWDADWHDYSEEADEECASESCDLIEGDSSGEEEPPTVFANLCEWDGQDYFRHVVDSGGGVSRRFDVVWNLRSTATVEATLYPETGDPVPFESPIGGVLRLQFCEGSNPLDDGSYQIGVSTDEPVFVQVNAYTNTFGCAE